MISTEAWPAHMGDQRKHKSGRTKKEISSKNDADDDKWSEFNFEWLFDPDRFDHLPINEQLELYEQRDLKKTKAFKTASHIWGGPISRKRVIYAKPMHSSWTATRSQCGTGVDSQPSTSPLKPPRRLEKLPSSAEIRGRDEQKKFEEYNNWVNERKSFRKNLDSMGLNEEWLARKPNKTALEQRVLTRMIKERTWRPPSPPPAEQTSLNPVLPDESPIVQRPSPLAIKIIEKFLHRKKMRLIDLFRTVDKNKNWKITPDEFRKAIREAQIPISNVLLEDLILTLDTNLNNDLDYRELAMGMGLWKIEKRESKRQLVTSEEVTKSPTKYGEMAGFEPPEPEEDFMPIPTQTQTTFTGSPAGTDRYNQGRQWTDGDLQQGSPTSPKRPDAQSRSKSAVSVHSTSSQGSQYLEPPAADMRPEQMILSSDEAMLDLRKRDREALSRYTGMKQKGKKGTHVDSDDPSQEKKTIIKTGDPEVDRHLVPSTMGGETGDLVDKFRQLKFKEYNDILNLCKENSVMLSEQLLKKVLLYPADRSHVALRKHIRQPAMPLLNANHAKPQQNKPSKAAQAQTEHTTRTKAVAKAAPKAAAVKSGKALSDGRYAYPSHSAVKSVPTKMALSTGKAVVNRQVECWMTFEEYDRLTRHLGHRSRHRRIQADDNAFWPGHLLDRMRLCMPVADACGGTNAVFTTVKTEQRTNVGYHNDLRTWPMNEGGYVQYGFVDPYWSKY